MVYRDRTRRAPIHEIMDGVGNECFVGGLSDPCGTTEKEQNSWPFSFPGPASEN
jgi:hypothetical protein